MICPIKTNTIVFFSITWPDSKGLYTQKKERIMFLLNEFSLLNVKTKKGVIAYIEDFYNIIESKNLARTVFNVRNN